MSETDDDDKLTSEDLAALIVDALIRGNVLKDVDAEKAVQIASEELNARKAMGDY